MSTQEQVLELGRRWTRAEVDGDTAVLGDLAVDDFRLVGPAGFVLNKAQWLERYESGAMVTQDLDWREVDVREYGDTAVAIGVHDQQATHQGREVNGQFRATHILVRRDGEWRLAGIHLSPMGGPPPFLANRPSA